MKDSYVYLDEQLKQEQLPAMAEHPLYFFSGDAADNSHQVDRELRIKDLVESEHAQLKYPVCFECFDHVIGKVQTKISTQELQRDLYMQELRKLEHKMLKLHTFKDTDLDAELHALTAEEAELDLILHQLAQQEQENQREFQNLEQAKLSVQKEEKEFWRDVNNYEKNLVGFQGTLAQADYLIQNLDWQFKRLRNTNFINEVFYVSTADEFGTISGFRLGKLPTTDVKWEEINAALG